MAENSRQILGKSTDAVIKTLIAGGTAGCCAKTTVAPFDRVKILLQAHNRHYKHLGVFSTIRHVVVREGPLSLYRGNGAQMVRVFPYAAVQFTAFEICKKKVKHWFGVQNPILGKLLAGSMAGVTAVLVTYPLDVIRARLAFQVAGEDVYTGIAHAFRVIFVQEGGVRGLYRGITPTLLGMAPYAGLSFCGFETLKGVCLDHFPHVLGKPCPNNTGGLVLIIPAKLLCGGLAGAFAQTVSYPLDVVRRHMQLSIMIPGSAAASAKWYETLMIVFRKHGLRRGLYRGLSINYIRVMPMVAVSFSTYELMKQLFKLDTGVDR